MGASKRKGVPCQRFKGILGGDPSCHTVVAQLAQFLTDNNSMSVETFQSVDLPEPVDFALLSEVQDAPIREAVANQGRQVVHVARAARHALDEIPVAVDNYLPIWAKIPLLPVIAPAGFSIGIFKRVYDAVSDLPVALMSIANGRIGFADVGHGFLQMLEKDVGAVPEVFHLMLAGKIMTAESRVGEVAFDVVPLVTGVGGLLKSVPQAVARMAVESIEAGAIVTRGAISVIKDAAESMAQTLNLEPEFAMAGGPVSLPAAPSVLDKFRAGAMAMSKHKYQPAWLSKPVTLAKSPSSKWRPDVAKLSKPSVLSTEGHRVIRHIKLHLGLDGAAESQLRIIVSRVNPGFKIRPDSFGLIFEGEIPEGAQLLGKITSEGAPYTVYYNPLNEHIYLAKYK